MNQSLIYLCIKFNAEELELIKNGTKSQVLLPDVICGRSLFK